MSDPARRRVIHWLLKGRAITRDWPVWVEATRSGGRRFDAAACEKLVAGGCVIGGQPHHLVATGENTYQLTEGPCPKPPPKPKSPTSKPPPSPTT